MTSTAAAAAAAYTHMTGFCKAKARVPMTERFDEGIISRRIIWSGDY